MAGEEECTSVSKVNAYAGTPFLVGIISPEPNEAVGDAPPLGAGSAGLVPRAATDIPCPHDRDNASVGRVFKGGGCGVCGRGHTHVDSGLQL